MMPRVLPLIRAAASEEGGEFDIPSMILHHLADSHEWETPFGVIHLPQFAPVHIGPLTIDFSITKHVLFMMIAAVLVMILLIVAARDATQDKIRGLILALNDPLQRRGPVAGSERRALGRQRAPCGWRPSGERCRARQTAGWSLLSSPLAHRAEKWTRFSAKRCAS